MNYVDVVRLVTNILFWVLGAVLAHFLVFAVVGIFKKKTYPAAAKKGSYGLIIPARNEAAVIAQLIESIRRCDYPQENLHIFVVAHNCTDDTAEVARRCGADVTVYEYDNPEENTMGYAFRYLFSRIEEDGGTGRFDGFFLFNADNILDKDFFTRMNDAYWYYDRKCVITSYRNSKNFGANLISGLYGMYFTVGCCLESRGRTVLGCSTRVQGTGYLINPEIVKDGWPYVSLTEDWEFTADQVLMGNNVRYCDEAVFYDEQPTDLRIMWRQRVRWSRGHMLACFARFGDMVRAIFRKGTSNRGSVYDITANLLPSPLFVVVLQALQLFLLCLAPLFDRSVDLCDLLFGTVGSVSEFLTSGAFLPVMIKSGAASFFPTFASAVLIFIMQRKRIPGVSLGKKILIALLWPLFLGIQLPIDVVAFFSRNLGWKPIPHKDQTSFDHVNPAS